MTELTCLAQEYKKTKSLICLNKIRILLKEPLKKKADFVFYQQKFVKTHHRVSIYNKKLEKYENKFRVETFRLCETNKTTIKDIEQELFLQVLELLHKYDARKPFDNYLFGTLKYWRPECVRSFNFRKDLNTINEADLPEKNDREGTLDDIAVENPEENAMDKIFESLNKQEKKYINLKKINPSANQSEMAAIMRTTQQQISLLIEGLEKKYKNMLKRK